MPHALAGWREEMRSAQLYRAVAAAEPEAAIRRLFLELAREAEAQAGLWLAELQRAGQDAPPPYRPDLRARLVMALLRRLGPQRLKPVLAAMKVRGLSVYSRRYPGSVHPMPTALAEVGASHRGSGSSGGLRAAVFGVNDGLVSIACLVLGVAGAAADHRAILLTGVAGLLAGAFSMAAGEYVSMRSQREMFEYQIGLERDELARYPAEEAGELALIYAARGMPQAEAHALAQRMIADPALGLDVLAREELGLNPDQLGSPWIAAASSFVAFAAGGAIPLAPFLLPRAAHALPASVALTAATLFAVGALLSLFTGRSALRGGARMLLIGGGAGLLTYAIGHLLGTSLA